MIVYAGAVMVLYVFVVAYVGGEDQPLRRAAGRGAALGVALLFAGALFVELAIAMLGSGLSVARRARARGYFAGLRHAGARSASCS